MPKALKFDRGGEGHSKYTKHKINKIVKADKKNYNNNKLVTLSIGKKNDDVETPEDLFNELNQEFEFDFDPCPYKNPYGIDGLNIDWGEMNFVNPPYSQAKKWIKKALYELQNYGRKSVLFVPLRLYSVYWLRFVVPYANEIRLVSPIRFKGYAFPLPIPLALIIFTSNVDKVRKVNHKYTYDYFTLEGTPQNDSTKNNNKNEN